MNLRAFLGSRLANNIPLFSTSGGRFKRNQVIGNAFVPTITQLQWFMGNTPRQARPNRAHLRETSLAQPRGRIILSCMPITTMFSASRVVLTACL